MGLNILGQAAQITLTLPSQARIPPEVAAAVADLCLVTLNLANLPAAVMFLAIALLSLRLRAYPRWLGWTAAAAADGVVHFHFLAGPGGRSAVPDRRR